MMVDHPVASDDSLFNKAIADVQCLLDAALRRNDGLFMYMPESRIRNLPALQREIDIMTKLEVYYRNKTAQLKEQEEIQKKLRVGYQYFHLPRLPNEIIIRILSYFSPKIVVDTATPYTLEVKAHGLLPHLIVNPRLVQFPFCKNFDTTLTLEDIDKQMVEIPLLTDVDFSGSVDLEVIIQRWKALQVRDMWDILRPLIQVPHLWKYLRLFHPEAEHLRLAFDALAPCLSHLEDLQVEESEFYCQTVTIAAKPIHIEAGSLRSASITLNTLQPLFDTGILNFITSLTLSDHFLYFGEFDFVRSILPRALSSMPYLKSLTIKSALRFKGNSSLRVKSNSLRSLTLGKRLDIRSPAPAFFSECPIESLSVKGKGRLKHLVEFFPVVKCLSCDDMSALSSSTLNGRIAFPQLEKLVLQWPGEIAGGDADRIFELILEVVRTRSLTADATRLKSLFVICSTTTLRDTIKEAMRGWEERLRQYIDLIEVK